MNLLKFERKALKDTKDRPGMTADAPSHVYLQTCGDCSKSCGDCVYKWKDVYLKGVTWCEERQNEADVEYIRLDMAVMSVLKMLGESDIDQDLLR